MPAKVPTLPKFTFKPPQRPCHIANLHDDLLYHIFQIAIVSSGASFNLPVILTRVCSRWRWIVRQAPRLWTRVGIQESIETPGFTMKHLRRVQHSLWHSQQLPLDVCITLRTMHHPYSMYDEHHPFSQLVYLFRELIRSLSTILAPHVWRFRRFCLTSDELPSVLDVQSKFYHGAMPYLECWETRVEGEEMGVMDSLEDHELGETLKVLSIPLRPSEASMSPGADFYPRLTALTVCGAPISFQRFAPTGLKVLTLCSLPVAQRPDLPTLRDMLLANQHSLETLSLCLAEPTGESSPFTMPSLTSLQLGFIEPRDLVPLIRTMRVPQLTSLSLLDQQRAMTFPMDLTGVYQDTSFVLIAALIENLPLSNLRDLLLSHIQFTPDIYDEFRHVEDVPNAKGLDIRALPFQFFAAMDKLETLSLAYPTMVPLNCLNYLPISEDKTAPKRPLQNLCNLKFLLFSLPLVQSFIKTREESQKTFGRIESISFTMPCEWQGDGTGSGLGGWSLCRRRHVNYFLVDGMTEQTLRSGVEPQEELVWD